jgi:Na+/H+-dicarboxylate symporter
MNLNTQILIAAIAGVGLGLLLTSYPQADFAQTTLYVLGILSSIFIGLLKMLLIPLIFSSIVVGVSNLQAGGVWSSLEDYRLELCDHYNACTDLRNQLCTSF